ncbi:MAG: zinc-dependent metalloprotease family protein, partial [Acidimicrobiia bacterium]
MSNHFAATGRARRAAVTIVALGLLAAGVGATSADASASTGRQRAEQVVSERVRGEAAIRALGTRLPEVAAANGTTAEELRGRLRADDELWVDPSGLLLYIDETLGEHADHDHAEAPSGTVDPVLGSPSTADALALHSRPGASRVLFLDFDGHASPGSGWSGTAGTPYDTDGSPSTFSDAERRVIIDVWRHVAEDFAPFGIDVTTQDPGIDAIRRTTSTDAAYGTRVVVTPTKTDCTSCGGIAYVGTYDIHGSDSSGWYHDRYQPAWVYVAGTNAKSIAEAASHEAGHNLGLSHDGVTGGTAYYAGHGDWAPIMGVGYYEPITQWSKGEYSGASNTEDDLAVIAANGGTPVADDHGATPTTATAIAAGTVDVSGVIGTRGDQDAFTFTAGPGTLSLQVAPATVGPDVDLS